MHSKAPKPPTKVLLLAAGTTGGISLCLFVMIWIGHVIYDNIPTGRLIAYTATWVTGAVVTVGLAGYYLVQRWRRDAWWDGHTACDDPDADTLPLRRVQAELAELAEAVHSLADAAGRPRPPQPRAQPAGSTYTSRAVQNDTVMMVTGSAQQTQVQVADRPSADPIAEARVEGYVEGYADGVTRRDEGTSPN
ncbi:hypothetical protein ABZ388_06615 [Micromonospora parva]|uniref:hypothetical protein n=1 Tax=Micromonospora parva TaxID=1464048 RepID=UPI0033C7BBCC